MPFSQTVAGAVIIGVIASLIFFFIQKGMLDSLVFRDDAKSAAEQAKKDAFRAEALRQQEAAARANAEAEAERIRRNAIEIENRRAQQEAAEAERTKQKRVQEENRRAQIQAEIEGQQLRQRAQEEAQARQRRLRDAAQAEAIERASRARAYRAANGGCDVGSHRVCVNVGPSGGGPGGYQAGCVCMGD